MKDLALSLITIVAISLGGYAFYLHGQVAVTEATLEAMVEGQKAILAENASKESISIAHSAEVNDNVEKAVPSVRAYAAGLRVPVQPSGSSCAGTPTAPGTAEPDEAPAHALPPAPELQADCAETTVMVLAWQDFYTRLVGTWNSPEGIISQPVPAVEEKEGIYAGTEQGGFR